MGIRRLGIANPAAESDTTIFTATEPYLASVVATNKSASATADISVWVEPFGATLENEYAYIIYNLPVDQLNSYETFRFAVNTGDQIHVESSTADVSFQAYGLVQYDVKLGVGVSSYSASAPSDPIAGLIWVDSESSEEAKTAYVYDGSDFVEIVGGIDTNLNYNFTGTIGLPSTTSIGNVSSEEIEYLENITSDVQQQINNKENLGQ